MSPLPTNLSAPLVSRMTRESIGLLLDDALDLTGKRSEEHVAVARIVAEARDAEVLGYLPGLPLAAFFAQGEDSAGDKVGEDIGVSNIRDASTAVHNATSHRGTQLAIILMDRGLVSRSRSACRHGLFTSDILLVEVVQTLDVVPAVIAAGDKDIDFLVKILADIAREAGSCLRVEGEAPGVTKTSSPGLGPDGARLQGAPAVGGSLKEGVVSRDGVERYPLRVGDDRGMGVGGGVAWLVVHVDTENRGVEVLVDEASGVERVATAAAITTADVKVTIRSEVEVTSIVIARRV